MELQLALDKQTKLVEKLRAYEKNAQQAAKAAGVDSFAEALKLLQSGTLASEKELQEWKSKYEALNTDYTNIVTRAKNEKLDELLKQELEKMNTIDVNTSIKLIDRSLVTYDEQGNPVITEAVKALLTTDPILFTTFQAPLPAGVTETNNQSTITSFETELKSAKSQKELEQILTKYGKLN